MSFRDFVSDIFLQGFAGRDIGTREIIWTLFITFILSLYIFFAYRAVTRKTFYSKNFNMSLCAVALITAGIILTIQSSLVVSLGMVGALSIVRFRTAIKEPMDLAFMFWSISIGIMCGAGMTEIAVLTSLALTVFIMVLEFMPMGKVSLILVINAECSDEVDDEIEGVLKSHTKHYKIKSRNISGGRMDAVYEIRSLDEKGLARGISGIKGVTSCSVMSHDGEVAY
ncbi:MAG: DUF4956 domain-containing protein [Lachnospiraceae bacterium]|nr:DUF4956 domain-containing protein [Lachnospiraceae bacterium]